MRAWIVRAIIGTAIMGGWLLMAWATHRQLDDAQARLDQFFARQERIRARAARYETEVAQAMAKAGQGVPALNGARGLANRFEDMGFDHTTIVNLSPFLVDEQGRKILSDSEICQLAAGIQGGILRPLKGATPAERIRAVARARLEAGRKDVAVRNMQESIRAEDARRRAAAASGDTTEIMRILVRFEGY